MQYSNYNLIKKVKDIHKLNFYENNYLDLQKLTKNENHRRK